MPYQHNINSIKVSVESGLVNIEIMEPISGLSVVWIDQQNYNPATMEVCSCPNYRCWTNNAMV